MSKLSANKCYVDLSMLQTTNPKIIYLLLQRSLRCNINLSGFTYLNSKLKYTLVFSVGGIKQFIISNIAVEKRYVGRRWKSYLRQIAD